MAVLVNVGDRDRHGKDRRIERFRRLEGAVSIAEVDLHGARNGRNGARSSAIPYDQIEVLIAIEIHARQCDRIGRAGDRYRTRKRAVALAGQKEHRAGSRVPAFISADRSPAITSGFLSSLKSPSTIAPMPA